MLTATTASVHCFIADDTVSADCLFHRRHPDAVAGGRGSGVGGVLSSCLRLTMEGEGAGAGWQSVKSMNVKRHSAAAASISSTQVVV
jgi:hypothetical protein